MTAPLVLLTLMAGTTLVAAQQPAPMLSLRVSVFRRKLPVVTTGSGDPVARGSPRVWPARAETSPG